MRTEVQEAKPRRGLAACAKLPLTMVEMKNDSDDILTVKVFGKANQIIAYLVCVYFPPASSSPSR